MRPGAIMTVSSRGVRGSSISESSRREARIPISYMSTRTVVSEGVSRSTKGMSLNPTTEISPGQDSPIAAAASSTPSATRSFAATTAVGR